MKNLFFSWHFALIVSVFLSSTSDIHESSYELNLKHQNNRIAKKVDLHFNLLEEQEILIERPGANFIKVHFSAFRLPASVSVTVSNPEGSESYDYSGPSSKATYSEADLKNGKKSFSAMSITGDSVLVKITGNRKLLDRGVHEIRIDSILEGDFSMMEAPTLDSPDIQENTCGGGDPERINVACWEESNPIEVDRSRAVAKIIFGRSSCTAWRVGADNVMFTNNHCISRETQLPGSEIWFNYQYSDCDGSILNSVVKVTGADLISTNFDLDYTLFSVNEFASIQQFGHLGLDISEPTLGDRIYIPQHGSGAPKQISITSNANDSGLCKIDSVSQYGRTGYTDMGYMCDTTGGSSGSPVVLFGSNRVIALHHFGGCNNGGVKMNEIWPKVRRFFKRVIPAGDNESDSGDDTGGDGNADKPCRGKKCTK